ncbi:dual specificity protein phosphatase 19 [Hylaeus anthracinus]|uniref:dual specificity protein phosphatase 19 n=1 Tax=Hylaeus anthracinus TaxID=313031 RepID=UPI0023B9D541|nr:dual specificity protein phosphatase 19 [Hylaeus anthracinus]
MNLEKLIKTKKLHLRSCTTIITDSLGQRYEEANGEKKELPPGTPFVIDDKPDLQIACILPGLFLSSQDPVTDINILRQHKIRNILSIGIEAAVKFDNIRYYYCDLLDLPESDISVSIEKCIKIIDKNRCENILVHCNAGVSRSPTIVISYLMLSKKLSYDNAYGEVKKIRHCIKPNEGFVRQLKMLELPHIRDKYELK